MLLGPQHCRCLKILTLIFDFIVLFCCIFAFVLYSMHVVSCFVYICCVHVISVSSYYFCFVYICMYMCRAPLKISLLSGLPVEILQLQLQLPGRQVHMHRRYCRSIDTLSIIIIRS